MRIRTAIISHSLSLALTRGLVMIMSDEKILRSCPLPLEILSLLNQLILQSTSLVEQSIEVSASGLR